MVTGRGIIFICTAVKHKSAQTKREKGNLIIIRNHYDLIPANEELSVKHNYENIELAFTLSVATTRVGF